MTTLTDPYQASLFAGGPVGVRPGAAFERTDLGDGAWVEVARGWFGGADEVAIQLMGRGGPGADCVGWRHHARWMYERWVEEPRLSRWYRADEPLPHEALAAFRVAAGRRYGVRFGAVALNFYRNGSDSVAFHADRELRHLEDTLVAVLTFGSARPFLLRPAGGGRSMDLRPASGDLIVMGGTCQEHWEHAVPKVARGAGPRVSASVRWARHHGFEEEWAPADRRPAGSSVPPQKVKTRSKRGS